VFGLTGVPAAVARVIVVVAAVAAFFLVVWPAETVVHELGHALVALAVTDGSVTVRLAGRSPTYGVRIGRLQIVFPSLPGPGGGVTQCDREDATPREEAAIFLGGPAASAAWFLASPTGSALEALVVVAVPAAYSLALACLPMGALVRLGVASEAYADMQTDGYAAWRALRRER